jgi:excisionase family DNA binding protein
MAADTVAGFLRERRLPVRESEVVDVLRRLLGPHLVAADSAALTGDATTFLRAHSGVEPSDAAVESATKESLAMTAAMVQTSLSMAEAAELLGVDQSRVRHRIADGALYPLRVGRSNRLPSWQFADGRALGALHEVLSALPADLHPLEVAGFFLTPQPELEVHGKSSAPRDWLAGGGDPDPVVELAASLRLHR